AEKISMTLVRMKPASLKLLTSWAVLTPDQEAVFVAQAGQERILNYPNLANQMRELKDGYRKGLGEKSKVHYFSTSALNVLLRRRSEEHTSELQSLAYLVCRLLLEKKKLLIILRH